MSDDEPLYLYCDIHVRGIAAVVCRHPCNEKPAPRGIVENSAESAS